MLTKRLEDIDLTDIEALKDNGVAVSRQPGWVPPTMIAASF
jgi:hypothetical protein